MDQNNELLEYMYQDAYMGVKSITTLINTINNKDNKIKKTVEEYLKGYEKYLKIFKKLIKSKNIELKNPSFFAEMGSFMGIKMELMKDNSDSRIANMLIKGLNMGVIDITKKIDNYKDNVDKDIIKIAKEFLKFHEESIELLKQYL